MDASGADIRTNRAFHELVDLQPAPLARNPVRYFENKELLSPDAEPLARALAGTSMSAMRVEVERSDGSQRSVTVSAIPLRDAGGAVAGALAILQDVEELILPGRDLREVSSHTPALLFTTDAAGAFDSVNERWNAFIGTRAGELIGSGWTNFVHPEDLPRVRDEWSRRLVDGQPHVSQWRFLRSDGTYRWTEIRAEPLRDGRGRITRWFGSGTDVDAQRRALAALDFLAESGATAAGARDVDAVLDSLAHASLEGLADISIFDLEEEDGNFRRLVVAAPDAPRSAVEVTGAFETPRRGESHPIARAMVSGETIHIPYVDEAFIQRSVTPRERQEAWRFVDIRSMVCAPMMTSGRGLGALTLIRRGTSVPFERADVKVIEEVARRAAVTIENVRLRERERRAARDLQAFADMGIALTESLGLQKTLDAAMHVIVPERADWAFISLTDERRDLRLAAIYHPDESKSRMLSEYLGEIYVRGESSEGTAAVVRTGLPIFREKVEYEVAARVVAPDVLEAFWGVGFASIIVVPLLAGAVLRGTLHLCMESDRRAFARSDVEFLAELARRMAPAIANAELFERERRVARSFQDAALPSSLPVVPGFIFNAIYEAGKTEALVGGDWYDAFLLVDGRIAVSIGDVAGSGLSAAVTMAGVRQAIRGAAHVNADPAVMLEAANQAVLEDAEHRFVTAFVGVIETTSPAKMTYQCAGHPAPILRMPDGKLTELPCYGAPLSLRAGRAERNLSCALPSGSLLALFTDGLIESTRDVFEGARRVRTALVDPAVHGAENPAKMLHDAVLVDGSHDDVAILTIKVL